MTTIRHDSTVPLGDSAPGPTAQRTSRTDERLLPARRLQLLVIEDTEPDYDLLVVTLRREGLSFDSRRVETADEVDSAFATQAWDAVISDHQLPAYSSTLALQQVRSLAPFCPFIIVSGVIGEDAAVAAMRRGADDYLVKGRLARLVPSLLNAIAAAQARGEQARVQQALHDSRRELRELLAHLETVVDAERADIAREVHDEIGAALTALRLDLNWVAGHGDARSAARAHQATETLLGVLDSAQRLQRRLRPAVLDQGLVPGLRWLCEDTARRAPMQVGFRTNVESLEVEPATGLSIYRTLQEALTNAVKHSGASRIGVDLHADRQTLSLEIADDGRGIAQPDRRKPGSFGLKGMQERAERQGGWLEISGRAGGAGGGTVILLCLPRAHATAEAS